MSGEYAGDTLTLRFRGGLFNDKKSFTMPSHIPLFDVGNDDILFVKNNLVSECPLVNCKTGRLRVDDGLIYNDNGEEILTTDALASIRIGNKSEAEVFNQHKVGDTLLTKEKSSDGKRTAMQLDPNATAFNEYDMAWGVANNTSLQTQLTDISMLNSKINSSQLDSQIAYRMKKSNVVSANIDTDFSTSTVKTDPKQLMLMDSR